MKADSHSKPRNIPCDYLIVPLASSLSTDSPEASSLPQGVTPQRAGRGATTNKSWCTDFRPQNYVRGSRRSGRDDYWVFASDGQHAIRVHLRPRRTFFAPSSSAAGQEGEPRIDALSDARITHAVYVQLRRAACPRHGQVTPSWGWPWLLQGLRLPPPSRNYTSAVARWARTVTSGRSLVQRGRGTTRTTGESSTTRPVIWSEVQIPTAWRTSVWPSSGYHIEDSWKDTASVETTGRPRTGRASCTIWAPTHRSNPRSESYTS